MLAKTNNIAALKMLAQGNKRRAYEIDNRPYRQRGQGKKDRRRRKDAQPIEERRNNRGRRIGSDPLQFRRRHSESKRL